MTRTPPADIQKYLEEIPDEVLQHFQFSFLPPEPVQKPGADEDGFPLSRGSSKFSPEINREALQDECWRRFHENPQLNTSVRGTVGRMTGWGFEVTSPVYEIQEVIEQTELDHRNRLWDHWPKFAGRHQIEGELYLRLTLHKDGFIEVDFIDPSVIHGGGDDGTGIIYHSRKTTTPLFYNLRYKDRKLGEVREQVPSIYIARYPSLLKDAETHHDFSIEDQKAAMGGYGYSGLKGYNSFIVAWDKGLMTRRATAYLRTTIKWLNHYERLKQYEIDHKKSSGAYAWIFRFEDLKSFRQWCALSDEEKRQTSIGQPIAPGQKLILPPGMTCEVRNPTLQSLSGQDTDILDMVSSGLNEPSDIMTGRSSATFASVKASRGPMSDRTSDEVAYFERFLRHDFWSAVFFLRHKVGAFPESFAKQVCVGWDKQGEPLFKTVLKPPEHFLEISFPVSENIDLESRVRPVYGTKHASLAEGAGLPQDKLARHVGVGNYYTMRLRKAEEDARYPKLALTVDQEAIQERLEAEPSDDTLKKSEVENAD